MDPRPTTNEPTVAEQLGSAPKFSARRFVVWLVVSLLTAAVLLPIALTATPKQCTTCHEMQPYYDSWQASTHRAAVPNCLYCHVKPNVLNLVAWEAGFYRQIIGHFTGARPRVTTSRAPSNASCRLAGCHSLNRETSTSGELKINHRLHVLQARVDCIACHAGAAHEGVAGRVKIPPMQLCKQCHASKMAECSYCHSQLRTGPAPEGH